MKSIIILIGGLVITLLSMNSLYAQNSKPITAKIKVDGTCNECKERIENAAYIKGVKSCDWDKTSDTLTLVYLPEKVNLDEIQMRIAAIGHDTEKFVADSAAYANLPKCCAYKDGAQKH